MVGHTPRFDGARKLWFCDIELEAGTAYQPFVRLALCRYQPHSIDGHHISRVVLADFAQLLPRRVATLRPLTRGRLAVALSGPVGVGWLGGGAVTAGGIRASRMVTAEVQQLADGHDPDLGWVRAGDPTDLAVTVGGAGTGPVEPDTRVVAVRVALRRAVTALVDGGIDHAVGRVDLQVQREGASVLVAVADRQVGVARREPLETRRDGLR